MTGDESAPVPMLLWCPECHRRHIDEGTFATKPHHTHACQHCGLAWRPAIVATVGVQFLPGFKNETPPAALEEAEPDEEPAPPLQGDWRESADDRELALFVDHIRRAGVHIWTDNKTREVAYWTAVIFDKGEEFETSEIWDSCPEAQAAVEGMVFHGKTLPLRLTPKEGKADGTPRHP